MGLLKVKSQKDKYNFASTSWSSVYLYIHETRIHNNGIHLGADIIMISMWAIFDFFLIAI